MKAAPHERGDSNVRLGGIVPNARTVPTTAMISFAALVCGNVIGILWIVNQPLQERIDLNAPIVKHQSTPLPHVSWRDITAEAAITFAYENGATGEKLMPETLGGGTAFLDFDSDGDQDILFVNGQRWPWDMRESATPPATCSLYRNDGTGKFTDATAESCLAVSFYGMSVAVGDLDNDGDPDLCFSAVGQNRLFRNDRGRFTEITDSSGVGGLSEQWSTGIGWFDYDNDGDLDLWVCKYIVWSRRLDVERAVSMVGEARRYGSPRQFDGAPPSLYRNNGDQTFTDVSEMMGLQKLLGKSLGLIFVDINHDGWQDVLVTNDTVRNFLFLNQQGAKFEEVGCLFGIAHGVDGATRAGMGVDVGLFRERRADVGVAIGNFTNEMTGLYVMPERSGVFTDEAVQSGIARQTRQSLTFGVLFLDFDLDGRLDLFEANGHVEPDIFREPGSQTYEQRALLFWNHGGTRSSEFIGLSEQQSGPDLFKPIVGRSAAYADIDNDGDLDLLIGTCHNSPRLLRNEQSNGHHWARFSLRGTKCSRDAIGAEVTIEANGVKQTRFVNPTRSYFSQCERAVTFGVGNARKIESAIIRWPGGQVQELGRVGVDQTLHIEQSGLAEPVASSSSSRP